MVKESRDPSMSSQRHLSHTIYTVVHLDLLCYALSTAGTSTATSHWSWAFDLLKFDYNPKKTERLPCFTLSVAVDECCARSLCRDTHWFF